jgi:hypothetical protein
MRLSEFGMVGIVERDFIRLGDACSSTDLWSAFRKFDLTVLMPDLKLDKWYREPSAFRRLA